MCECAQSYPLFCEPMGCSPLGSFVSGLLQARILEWVAIPFSRASSWPRDCTLVSFVSCIARHTLYHRAAWVIITTSVYLNDIHKNSVSKCVTLVVGDYREPKHSVHCRCCSLTQSTRVAPRTVHTRSPIQLQLLELAQTHVHWVSDSIQLRQKLLSSQQGRAVINFCSIYLREEQLVTINLKPITGQGAGKMVVTYFED